MPNEQINYPKWVEAPNPTGDAEPMARLDPVVQVGWKASERNEEGAVQLLMTLLNEVPVAQIDSDGKPRKWPKSDERGVVLNRIEINKLIRTLRRARDQAFGQDE